MCSNEQTFAELITNWFWLKPLWIFLFTFLFIYISVYSRAAHCRSEQLLSTERSRDLIELSPIQKSFRLSTMIHTLVRQTGRTTTSFRPGRSPGLKGNGE